MLSTTSTLLGPTPPRSAFLEGFRVLRANLLALQTRAPFRTVMITSAQAREGKTTVAANLAIVLSLAGKRTILVDADPSQQGLGRALDLRGLPGLTDVCSGSVDLDAVLQPTQIDTLHCISAGTLVERASELMLTPNMHDTLQQLAARSDLVLLDATPSVGFGSALSLAPLADLVLLVARARGDVAPVQHAIAALADVGANIGGVIVNDIFPQDSAVMESYIATIRRMLGSLLCSRWHPPTVKGCCRAPLTCSCPVHWQTQ